MTRSCRNNHPLLILPVVPRYLSVEDNVEFLVNLPYPELMKQLGGALVGIHTMWNEHFGISRSRYTRSVYAVELV